MPVQAFDSRASMEQWQRAMTEGQRAGQRAGSTMFDKVRADNDAYYAHLMEKSRRMAAEYAPTFRAPDPVDTLMPWRTQMQQPYEMPPNALAAGQHWRMPQNALHPGFNWRALGEFAQPGA